MLRSLSAVVRLAVQRCENRVTDREPPARAKRPVVAHRPGSPSESSTESGVEESTPAHRPVAPRKSRRRGRTVVDAQSGPLESSALAERQSFESETLVAAGQRPPRTGISYEAGLYILFIVVAFLTRFWNLGFKALHHDESLHAYYSWVFETGGDYRHHPLMHGPFLFHANALVYLLFGDSDASSRYMPAFFGVILVALPYLLRSPRLLGRWGAISASFLFLISPVLLYQSRYIRHDIYTVVGTLLLFTAIVRYWETPERRWLVIGAGTIAFLLTNHEIVFAIVPIFGGYLYGALVISRSRAWWPERRPIVLQVLGLHVAALLLVLGVIAFMPTGYKDRIFDIPWEDPTTQQQTGYYQDLLTNPLVLSVIAVLVAFVVGMWTVLSTVRDVEQGEEGWLPALFGEPSAQTVESGIRNAWADKTGLTIATLVAVFIFVTLFTSLYTNLYGLVSSTIATDGTLLYWLGQHDVRRGEQPWFYFMLLLPQYEFFAVVFGIPMAAITVVRVIGNVNGRLDSGKNLFVRFMITVWLAGVFVALSLAGEKMPWLLAHIALPATLLAAIFIGGLIEHIAAARQDHVRGRLGARWFDWPDRALVALLLSAASCWFFLAGSLSHGRFPEPRQAGGWTRTITSFAADHWWWLAIPPVAGIAAIVVATMVRGSKRSGLAALSAATIILMLLQIHTGWRLSYVSPDVPTEMMIYTQTSPDVTRIVGELSELSYELTGNDGIEVWYDSGVSWPMQWYLRNFPNKRFVGSSISGPPDDVPILIISTQYEANFDDYLSGYSSTEYVLRWWFPEDIYRDFAIAPEIPPGRSAWKSKDDPHGIIDIAGSIADTIENDLSPEGQARLYRLLLYRDLEQPLGQYNFKVYIRNDLIPVLNAIRY